MQTALAPERTAVRACDEPLAAIHLSEDHDAAYDAWKAAGVRDRVLVHFDGHLDFDWIADHSVDDLLAARSREELESMLAGVHEWSLRRGALRARVNIANFVYAAIKEGLVRRFVWVMPDPFWQGAVERRAVHRGLARRARRRSSDAGRVLMSDHGVSFEALGRHVTACTLDRLPAFDEPVLLDIDVDYLLTWKPVGRPPYFDRKWTGPWMWPSRFAERLREARLTTDLATIAYSVNGGFTPLRYKYFGDAIAAALARPDRPVSDAPPRGSAADAFDQASRALAADNLERARAAWQAMTHLDPSYRNVYATGGWCDETLGRWQAALTTYDRVIALDPGWHAPHVGRGRALWRLRRYDEADAAFQRACALTAEPTAATYWLGRCQLRRGEVDAAVRTWTRAVADDPDDSPSWYALARVEARRGRYAPAAAHAGQAVIAGRDGPGIRWLLARASWQAGHRRAAWRELRMWGRQLPAAAASRVRGWKEQFTR
jgi:tetratricopeptide (TPR) repeat protein